MAIQSAGILLFRSGEGLEVLLAHPGGPFWARKDEGAWSIPKGEFVEGEDPADAARREFREELGAIVTGELIALDPVRIKSGKWIHAFACRGDFDPRELHSNRFEIEWPPRSGRMREFPEVDRVAWFPVSAAGQKITAGQRPLLEQLVARLGAGTDGTSGAAPMATQA